MSANRQEYSTRINPTKPAAVTGDQAAIKAAVPDTGDYTVNLEFEIPVPQDLAFEVGAIRATINNLSSSYPVAILSKSEGVVRRFTLNKANNWSWNSGSLPMSKEDGAVTWQYYLKEVNVPDHFTVTYSPAGTDGKSGKITSAGSATITATNAQDDIVDLKVKKAWNPVEVPAGAEIELSLYAGKTAAAALATEPMRTITLDGTAGEVDSDHNQESPAWQANFKNLPKYGTDGTELVYIVKETEGVEGYAVKYDESGEATYVLASDSTEVDEDTATITNEQLGNGSLKITKSEVDVTNTLGNEPRTYKLAVKDSEGKYYKQDGTEAANKEAAWVVFKLPSETATDYTKTWENLPTGTYTVEEEAVDKTGYLWTVTGLGEVRVAPGVETEHAVVNTFDTLTTDVPVTKTWSDSYSGNWSATFALKVSKRLYSVDGVVKRYSSAHVGWSAFEAVTETVTIEEQEVMRPVTLTITNESVDPKFAEQPKYETDPVTGNVYELKYTADETEFTTGNGKTYTLQGISEATRQADGTFNAIEAVNTPDGKTQVKVEKVWSDGTVNHGDVTLRLVRYKAGVPTQKLRINHTVSGLDSFPAGFVATYTVSGGPTVIDNPVNGGEYDVEPGTYTVAVNVTNPAAPTEKVYNGTSPDSVDVTITREQGGTAAFVSSYGDKQYGNLQIRHGVSGQDSLPAGFSATYTISNGSTVVVANAEAETDYRLEAGISYTVTATVSGETVANYYASTNSPNAIVVADERVYADVTTSYAWAGGYLTFTHVADPSSATLPSGITYTVSGPTTISNPVPGTEYPVAAGEYTVTASGVGNISGYTRNATQNDESKGVTVAAGQHASVALTSHYTSDRRVKVTIKYGKYGYGTTLVENLEVNAGSVIKVSVTSHDGFGYANVWDLDDESVSQSITAYTSRVVGTDNYWGGSYDKTEYTVSVTADRDIGIGVSVIDNSGLSNAVEASYTVSNETAYSSNTNNYSPFQLAFNPFVAYADEDHSTFSELASAGYGRDASFNRTVDVGVSNDWTALITGLDVYDEYGQPYYYGIEEVSVPEDYTASYSDPWNAESMLNAAQTVTLTATNTKDEPDVGHISVTKTDVKDVDSNTVIAADNTFSFTIKEQGKDAVLDTLIVTKGQTDTSIDLELGKTYVIEELTTGRDIDGYVFSRVDMSASTVNLTGTTTVNVSATNYYDKDERFDTVPDSVTVNKLDENNTALSGATFKLYSANDDGALSGEVATYTASSFTIATGDLTGHLSAANNGTVTLYLKETVAPTGYVLDDTIHNVVITTTISDPTYDATAKKWVTTTTYTMTIDGLETKDITNTPDTDTAREDGSVTVYKTDSTNPLPGATFTLYDGEDEVKSYYGADATDYTISTSDPDLASVLPAVGATKTLTLKETAAPEGYIKSDAEYTVVISASQATDWNNDHTKLVTTTTYAITIGGGASVTVPNTPQTGSVTFTQVKTFKNGAAATAFGYTITEYTDDTYETEKLVVTSTGSMSAATSGTTMVNYTLADVGNHYYGVKENLPAGTTPTETDIANDYVIVDNVKYDLREHKYTVNVAAGTDALVVTKDAQTVSNVESAFTNEQLGDLQVTKTVQKNGTTDTSATGTFYYAVYSEAYNASADPAQVPVRTGSITIGSEDDGTRTATESDLSFGTYYVYELDGAGGTPIVSGNDGVKKAIDNTVYTVTGSGTTATVNATAGTVTLTNNHETIDLEVNKAWAPVTSWPRDVISITVQLYSKVGSADATPITGKTLTITPENSAATAATVEAAEGDEAKAAQQTLLNQRFFKDLPKYDSNGAVITYSVVETAVTGTKVSVEDFTITYSPAETTDGGLITITNTQKPISLTVIKVEKETSIKLPNAEFQLTKKNSGGTYEVFVHTQFGLNTETNKNTGPFSVGSSGEITINNLLPGDYKLKETKAPAGYIIATGDIEFTINVDGTVTVGERTADDAGNITYTDNMVTFAQKTASAAASVTVQNEPGVALPATGGVGTGIVYGAGAALVLLAVLGMILTKRKRTDGEGIR